MPIHNADIAVIFEEIADLLEIEGGNPFRIRAYRNAARIVGEFGRDLAALIGRGAELPKLPGIGADLAGKIKEIGRSGTCALLERLHRELPPAITELLKIPGLGPKRVRQLYADLGSKEKVLIELACSSHNAMWEKNRMILFKASLEWLRDGKVNGVTEGVLKLGY